MSTKEVVLQIADLPVELQKYIRGYLDQEKAIQEMRDTIKFLQNKVDHLRSLNTRLTLQSIEQHDTIRELEHMVGNGLPVDRQIDFDFLSDSEYDSDETIIEITHEF